MDALLPIIGLALVAIIGVGGTWLNNQQQASARREERREDWARQDEVAARVETAAKQAARAAALLVKSDHRRQARDGATTKRLKHLQEGQDDVHTLVNNRLTEEKRGRLALLKAHLVLLEEGRQTAARKRSAAEVRSQIKAGEAELAERAEDERTVKAAVVKRKGR
jgi:hypothetical protein